MVSNAVMGHVAGEVYQAIQSVILLGDLLPSVMKVASGAVFAQPNGPKSGLCGEIA